MQAILPTPVTLKPIASKSRLHADYAFRLDWISQFRACDVACNSPYTTSHATQFAPTWRFTVGISRLD